MRRGFTTGSCAAAAARAAADMLFTGSETDSITIVTPSGEEYTPQIEDMKVAEGRASCAVRKDGGDDPDITTGALIYAEVSLTEGSGISIDGGEGVGRVTKPGLDMPPGEAAINSVPRKMIERELAAAAEFFGYSGGLNCVISVPEGRKIAEKTFNPMLGIEGGISILGTTGIVEPMSTEAVIGTIKARMSVRRAAGYRSAALVFGNYGETFLLENYSIPKEAVIACSNFIGRTLDLAVESGFSRILICGHTGKLVKLAGGIMNTHSREADCRMELIAAACLRAGGDTGLLSEIIDMNTTDAVFALLRERGLDRKVSGILMERICHHVSRRIRGQIGFECMMYSGGELLAGTEAAAGLAEELAYG